MQSKGVAQAQKRIREAMVRLRGVKSLPHRFGGVEFRLERRELGHIHGDWLVDIPFSQEGARPDRCGGRGGTSPTSFRLLAG